jgi:WD40 repeat protein
MTKIRISLTFAAAICLLTAGVRLNQLAVGRQQGDQNQKSKESPEEIDKLIAQLGSREFAERESATRALEMIGQPALSGLIRAVAASEDAEIRKRAQILVRCIEDRLADIREFRGHKQGITQVCFSPDGTHFLSTSYEGVMKLWETKTVREIRQFETKERIILPDKRALKDKGGRKDRTLQIIYRAGFLPDGQRAVTGGQDGHLCLWDLRSGKTIRYFPENEHVRIMALAISPDGRQVLSGGTDQKEEGELRLWDLYTGKELRYLGHLQTSIFCTTFLSDDQALSAGRDGIIRLWDLKTGKETRRFEGHSQAVTHVSASPKGTNFLSSSWDQTVRLWDIKTTQELRRFQGHADMVRSAKFTPDGKRALSASHDRTERLWDVDSGRQLRLYDGFAWQIADVDISGDARFVLSGGMDGTLRLARLLRAE